MTSKELEALEKIKQEFGCDPEYYGLGVDFEIVEKALLKAQEIEKVLKIIKKYIYYSTKSHCIRMKEIRKSIYNFDYEDLKEWLENGKN